MNIRSVLEGLFLACAAAGTLRAEPLNGRPVSDDIFYHFMPITWRDADNDTYRFGDFDGMTASLDYLQQLGITAVWMNPIFPSPAYHGYQHGRVDQVNSRFGTEAQFLNFVQQAHARGIKVFIDLVAYGISHDSVHYQSAYNNPASPYDAWLAFTNAANTTYLGSTYTTWNGATVGFIHLNLNNPATSAQEINWGVRWLDPNGDLDPSDGIDGYRLDHVSSNDATEGAWGYHIDWWMQWKNALLARNPSVFTFAEQADWGSYGADLMPAHDATMTKPFLFAARTALSSDQASGLYGSMASTVAALPAGHTFLGTLGDHDVDRLASAIGGGSNNLARAKLAAVITMTMPYPPVIYYGDEIGMLGTKGDFGSDANDIPMREPFKWNAVAGAPMSNYWVLNSQAYNARFSKDNDGRSVQEQNGVAGSLLEAYKTLIAVRKNHLALRKGAYYPVTCSSSRVWSFVRYAAGQESLVVAMRLHSTQATSTLNLSSFSIPGGSTTIQDVISGQTLASLTDANKGAYPITLPAYGYKILALNIAPPPPVLSDYDGVDVPGGLGAANLVATQNNATGLGDNISELNQLFIHPVSGGIRLGITGNLSTDGTALALLVDTTTGGQNVLNFSGFAPPPGGPDKLTGLRLDPGFAPDHMIFINLAGSIYVDQFALPAGAAASKTYRGAGTVGSGVGTLSGGTNPNGMQVAMNNTNVLGITGTSASGAATATTGFEMLIPYADIGVNAARPRGAIRVAAFLMRSNGQVSNQWLPGLGGGYANLGLTPDMTTIPGLQFAAVSLDIPDDFDGDGNVDAADFDIFKSCLSGPNVPRGSSQDCQSADLDGDHDVDQDDYGAFQRCYSGAARPSAVACAD